MLNVNELVGFGAGGDGGRRRYWRLKVNANGGSSYVVVAELEFRETAGVTQPMTGGVALASDETLNAAANAFDASTGTVWSTNATPLASQWLQYAFPQPKDIKQVYAVSGGFASMDITNADVQSSIDGSTWETVSAAASLVYSGGAAVINL